MVSKILLKRSPNQLLTLSYFENKQIIRSIGPIQQIVLKSALWYLSRGFYYNIYRIFMVCVYIISSSKSNRVYELRHEQKLFSN